MPTFRKQIRVKCEFSFVEWANQPGIRTSKRVKGQGWKPTLLDPKLYRKIFGGTISQFHKAFLFLNLVIRVYFAFLGSKVTELLWWSLFPVCMAHGGHITLVMSLFIQSLPCIFLTERLHTIDKTWDFL